VDPPRREVAVGLVVAGDGRVLLQHRDDRPGVTASGMWGLFGGHLEGGERPEKAFLREMDEELSWCPRHFEPYAERAVDRDGWRVVSHVFAAHLDVPFDALTQHEGQGMGLFAPDALPAQTLPAIRELLVEFVATGCYRRVRRRWDTIVATALLVDRAGQFLLQHRDDKAWIANPGRWGSFGGEIEPYETPHDGFLRELREELAWTPRHFELWDAFPYDALGARSLMYVFAGPVDVPLEAMVLGEGQGMASFPPGALPAAIVPDLRLLIERFTADPAYAAIMRRA
jgi:8-oxo-dGTP diphosphatase